MESGYNITTTSRATRLMSLLLIYILFTGRHDKKPRQVDVVGYNDGKASFVSLNLYEVNNQLSRFLHVNLFNLLLCKAIKQYQPRGSFYTFQRHQVGFQVNGIR